MSPVAVTVVAVSIVPFAEVVRTSICAVKPAGVDPYLPNPWEASSSQKDVQRDQSDIFFMWGRDDGQRAGGVIRYRSLSMIPE